MSGVGSGAKLDPECLNEYCKFKTGKNIRYIVFKLTDSLTEIVVEQTVNKDENKNFSAEYENLVDRLREVQDEGGCRYVVVDFEYQIKELTKSKMIFISWAPDTSKIKQKMVYTSSQHILKKPLDGISLYVQGNDLDDVSFEYIEKTIIERERLWDYKIFTYKHLPIQTERCYGYFMVLLYLLYSFVYEWVYSYLLLNIQNEKRLG